MPIGVTADSTIWTADTVCVTADGRIICIPAIVAEAADAADIADAVSDVVAGAIEPAVALDEIDAVTDVAAAAVGYVLTGFDATFVVEPVAAVGYVLTGFDVAFTITPATTTGYVLTGFDASFVVEPVTEVDVGGGVVGRYYPPLRPRPIVGHGYGVLPELWGEAHGVVGAVAKGAAQIVVSANAIGACGQAGDATAVFKGLAVAGKGAVGARGAGAGVIVKLSGSATGQHDDDAAAVIAFLLAA